MERKSFMRADKELLNILKQKKRNKKDSYADVVRRLLEKEGKLE